VVKANGKEVCVVAASAVLGSGFVESSFERCLTFDPHFIGCDAGTTDAGPVYLGTDKTAFPLASIKRDLKLQVLAGQKHNIPVLIGSCGTAGNDAQLKKVFGVLKEIVAEEKLSLKANQQLVAEHFHISARTLNRHLQKEHTSLKQVVTECRVHKAKQLLLDTDLSIEQIALQLGLSGRRTLDRIFIKQTDHSPAQYRNKQKSSQNVERQELQAVGS
jgi:AraC-like DNA-binding protein